MEKLLHERLRDGAAKTDLTFTLEIGDEKVDFRSKHALAIADEIERYYIPRPRFEDGEPIQNSDLEEIGAMATCRVFTDGSWVFDPDKFEDERNPKQWDKQEGRQYDSIKRPTPKVYDAYGVEIKVGDKGWLNYREHEMLEIKAIHTKGSTPWYACDYVEYSDFTLGKAKYFTHEKPVFDADGERIKVGDTVYDIKDGNESVVKRTDSCNSDGKPIICRDGCPGELWYKPEQLTHTEPVFDADGVRICKGDTVWTIHTAHKFTVHGFTDDGAVIVRFGEDADDLTTYVSKGLTHKEPDSLEKLRDDMNNCSDPRIDVDDVHKQMRSYADRLTALIERGA